MSANPSDFSQVGGVILAAGASSRMGQPKGAMVLSADGETVVQRVVRVLLEGGLPRMVVVTGAHPSVADTLAADDSRVTVVHHAGWAAGQLSSLQCGLRWLQASGPIEAAVVTLVDVPFIEAGTVTRLLEAWQDSRAPIVRPVSGVRHGHPVVFDACVFGELLAADPAEGAKPVIRAHAAEILNVPVQDEGAFLDVDTPEEFAQALRRMGPAGR
jgi:molybdenum cofactor cytidylyltransferase